MYSCLIFQILDVFSLPFSEILDLFMFIFLFQYLCCHCFSNEDVDTFLAPHLHFFVYQ